MEPFKETEKKEKRDVEFRRRILSAASCLLERNGIDSVNMYQIAQEAGIGQGTLYRRYGHPGEIYSDILRTSVEQFLDELEAQQSCAAPSSSPLDRLSDVIIRLVDYIDRNAELLTTINCMYAGKKNFLPHKRPITLRLQGLVGAYLERAAEQGETRDCDVTLTTGFLLAALSPEQYLYHRDTLGYTRERYQTGVCRLFIEGIRARGEQYGEDGG
ncbi:TetR/AcrR family transcriptional regulator [Paenibacillus sp. MBLB4367]|uniref:TetR/AcrR family transcriptional regulator n=1 Tax=Paenibacillus sp. MBLB4367 TaxID=3384767 RepID=UPI00390802A8